MIWSQRFRLVPKLCLVLLFPVAAAAQVNQAPPTTTSKLRVEVVLIGGGTEAWDYERLAIRLHNDGQIPLSLPEPTRQCSDSDNGWVAIYHRALRVGVGHETIGGCITECLFCRKDVLTAATKWKTIEPNGFHEVMIPLAGVDLGLGGKYELHATYNAPDFTAAELKILEEHGIWAVRGRFDSMPIVVEKDSPSQQLLAEQLTDTIAKIRQMNGHSMVRTGEAKRLSELIKQIDPKNVDDATVTNLVSLLNIPDDSVRRWVAVALGNLGDSARVAAPELLRVLRQIDCVTSRRVWMGYGIAPSIEAASAIRAALKRIGEVPPPAKCDQSE